MCLQQTKQCIKCGEAKAVDNFDIVNKATGNRRTVCHACRWIAQKSRPSIENKRNADAERGRAIRQTAEGKELNKAIYAKYQAKKRAPKILAYLESNDFRLCQWIQCSRCNKLKLHKDYNSDNSQCARCNAVDYRAVKRKGILAPVKAVVCKDCGASTYAKHTGARCKECKRIKIKASRKIHKEKRKAIKRKASIAEPINPMKVIKRDNWRCCMCGCKVQKNNSLADNAAEIDHIVPLSGGGAHTYSNVQTLCRLCNRNKANKLIGQLVMCI